jgi:enoyl-CoA hydratase/carnithine racemase
MTQLVVLERHDPAVALVKMNRPGARNALDLALVAALDAALAGLAADDALRALVLAGEGPSFCAGADLRERLALEPDGRAAHTAAIAALADRLAAFPVPTLAAIRGHALAGGAELALACDLRLAADDATIGFPEVALGIFPGAGAPVRLPRLIGPGAARDLLFTGRRIDAHEAARLGLVTRVVPADSLVDEALACATKIASHAPQAMRALKRGLCESDGLPPAEAHAAVARHRRRLDDSSEYAEGLAAFAEGRAPRF